MWPSLLRPEPRFLLTMSLSTGPPLCRSGLTTLTTARRPGEVGLTLTSGMALRLLREVDFLSWLEADVRLLPVPAAAGILPEALGLALDVGDLNVGDLNFEQQLDGSLHFRFGCVRRHAKHDLIVLVRDRRRLFRDGRREDELQQTLLIILRRHGRHLFSRAHPSISSSWARAALVSSTFSNRTRLTGSISLVSRTSTSVRLRDASTTLSSSLSVTTSTVPVKRSAFILSANCLVFGASTAICSTTESLLSRTS